MRPIPPALFVEELIDPGLDWVSRHIGVHANRMAARVFLLAVAIQETNLEFRAQAVQGDTTRAGPARGFWQFEQLTIGLLMKHRVTAAPLRKLCEVAWVRWEQDDIWRAIEGHDLLAFGVARLLLLSDPQPVPLNAAEGWRCYNDRLWRPGKPFPDKWPIAWNAAAAACSVP